MMGKTYESFDALLRVSGQFVRNSNVGHDQTFCTLLDQNVENSGFINNFYGGIVTPTNDSLSQVMVTITSSEIRDKLIEGFGEDYETDNVRTWDWLKLQSVDVSVEIGVILKDSNESHKTIASFNTGADACDLKVDGTSIGQLSENPIDAIKSAIDRSDKRLIEAAEKVIWDFVNVNSEQFIN